MQLNSCDVTTMKKTCTALVLISSLFAADKYGAHATYDATAKGLNNQDASAVKPRKRPVALGGATTGIVVRHVWTGESNQGSISSDGRYISFTSSSHWPDLMLHDLTNGTDRKIATKSYPRSVISADGKYVAYACVDPDWHICVVGTEPGAKPRDLYHRAEYSVYWPTPSAWSLDDRSVLANLHKSDGTVQLAWIAASDGSIKVLKSLEWRRPGRPSLSPDGRYIAYAAHEQADSAGTAIYILRSDGDGESVVIPASSLNQDPVWTPDGRRIVFISNRSGSLDLWSIAVRGGKAAGVPVLAKADMGKIQPLGFTRSGSYYYKQITLGHNVFVADLESSGIKTRDSTMRLSDQFVGANQEPSWSPDGRFIAFTRFTWGTRGTIEYGAPGPDLVVRSLETGDEKIFSNLPSGVWMLGQAMWFRDGKSLLQQARDQQGRTCFYRLDLASGEFKQLVRAETLFIPDYGAAALSDDERFVYTPVRDWNNNTGGVAAVDLGTGRQTPIFMAAAPPGGQNLINLALSPNGRTLAMVQMVDRVPTLAVVNVDGSGHRTLPAAAPTEFGTLAWSKDGGSIFFGRYENDQWSLMRIAVTDGRPEFAGLTGKGEAQVHRISLSPDGQRIAFADGYRETVEVWALDNLLPVIAEQAAKR